MRPRFATLLVVVMALVGSASASVMRNDGPPRVVTIGLSRGGSANRVHLDADGVNAVLSFDVTSTSSTPREVTIPLSVAPTAHVMGMTMRTRMQTLDALRRPPVDARSEYVRGVYRRIDPALLEHTGTRDGRETLRLRVFPVSRSEPVHIEIQLIVAESDSEWRTIMNVARMVSPEQSLVALEAAPRLAPVISCHIGQVAEPRGELDKTIIRRYVQRNLTRVKACYDRALRADRGLAGHVDLHFLIGGDGTVRESSVDGDLATRSESLRTCIADELATWTFPSTDLSNHIAVNYPLELK